MSFQAMAWAIKQTTGNSLSKFVLLILANYANDRDECWPSMVTLGRDTQLARSTLAEKIKELTDEGFITKDRIREDDGLWSHNVYKLALHHVRQPDIDHVRQPDIPCPPAGHKPIKEPINKEKGGLSKISKDWRPSPALLIWAEQAFPNVEIAHETDKFLDYWLSTGQKKADWDATWRNWIRRSRTEYRPQHAASPRGGRAQPPAGLREPERLARDNRRRADQALSELRGETPDIWPDEG